MKFRKNPQKSKKIQENTDMYGNSQKTTGIQENPQNSLKIQRNLQKLMLNSVILGNSQRIL